MASAAELAILLTAKDLTKQGFDSATSGIGAFGKAAVTALAGLSVALVGIGAASVSAAAGFEQTMSGVKAVSGGTADEIKGLSALALQLGKDTSFSASEAAMSIEELVKGGLSISDIMNGAAKATLNLAAAGGVDLVTAATISANALAQFNLKGADMAHVADLIAGAANASALDVNQFGLSLSMSGAVASTVGFKFDDLAQAIAVMGKAGITGSDAGTSLKTMMLNLAPTTDKAAGLMKELGIITATGANQFFDATGKVKSMAEVAGILQTATANLTNEQKLSTLATLFGSDAIRAAAIFSKEGAAGFREMAESMGKVTAESVGAERLNNWKGSIEQLKGSLETAGITLGMAFLPLLKQATDATTGIVNAALPWIETAGPQVVTWLENAGAAAMKVVTAFQSNGLTGAFKEILPHINTAREALWRWVTEAMPGIIKGLEGMARAFLAWIVNQVDPIKAQLLSWGKALTDWIAPRIEPFITEVGKLAFRYLGWIVDQLPFIVAKLLEWGAAITDWIAPRIQPLLDELGKLKDRFLTWIGEQSQPILDKLGGWKDSFVAWVVPATEKFLAEWPGMLNKFLDRIEKAAPDIELKLAEWIPPFLKALAAIALAVLIWVGETALVFGERLYTKWLPAFYLWIADLVHQLPEKLAPLWTVIWNWIQETAPKVFTAAIEIGKRLVDGIINGLVSLPGRIADAIRNAVAGTPIPTVTIPVSVQQPTVTPGPTNNWNIKPTDNSGLISMPGGLFYNPATGQYIGGTSRDSGGPVSAGQSIMVGRGAQPELFVPSTAGTMYPKGSYGGSSNQTIQIVFNGPVTRDGESFVVDAIKRAISRGAIKSNVMVGQV